MPLNLRRAALGIAGFSLTIVDTCLKSGDEAEAGCKNEARLRSNVMKG